MRSSEIPVTRDMSAPVPVGLVGSVMLRFLYH
ncbi:hypothetical protein SAZ_37060 [Streptomyces noursei ZPM]|nr:hypothetical protein SAZ_37060 [Streptomyces noursei ZPM]